MNMKDKPELRRALGQIDVVPGRPDINAKRIVKASKRAAGRGMQVIIFPEMAVPGYLIGDKFNNDEFVLDVDYYNRWIIRKLKKLDIVVIFGTIGLDEDKEKVNENGKMRKYNAAFVAQRGKLISNDAGLPFAIKSLFPNYRIFDDSRYFYSLRHVAMERGAPLEELLTPFTVTIGGFTYKIGVMLCEDMWDLDYVQKPAEILVANGAEWLVNLSCSNWSWRKNAKRHQVVRDLIMKVGVPFTYVNNVGSQNNGKNFIPFDGTSTEYNEFGEIVFVCKAYEDKVRYVPTAAKLKPVAMRSGDDVKEMFDAMVASTMGFLRTAYPRHRQKVVIGLSGGIDSMVSAAFFVWLLGPENVILVNMPYKDYNSDTTKDIAAEGARNMGVTDYWVVPIDDMVDADAKTNGIEEGTSQHKTLQASMRHQVLKSIAAKYGGLIISNGNKTELAFGYATLIGDMRGYYALLADALKGEVYQLADFMNRKIFKREVIPQSCIDIPPMDELTKEGAGDRKDPFDYGRVLPDGTYEVGYHDAMVRSIVELQKGPRWFLEGYLDGTLEQQMMLPKGRLKELFPTVEDFVFDLEQKLQWFASAIHKRVQSVPAAHFSRSAFGWDFREYLPVVANDNHELVEVYYPRAYKVVRKKALAA